MKLTFTNRAGRNGKVPPRPDQDSHPNRVQGPHIASSQVIQELPLWDRIQWEREMLAPETEFERSERLARENRAPMYSIIPGKNPILLEIPKCDV